MSVQSIGNVIEGLLEGCSEFGVVGNLKLYMLRRAS